MPLQQIYWHTTVQMPDSPGVDPLPEKVDVAIIGGGFIATELGHVFDAFGSTVTIITRGPRMLRAEDDDVSIRFTELSAGRFNHVPNAVVRTVELVPGDGGAFHLPRPA